MTQRPRARRPRPNPEALDLWQWTPSAPAASAVAVSSRDAAPLAPGLPAGAPLVVSYGGGVDSTGVLVEFVRRGIRPDVILFADTGEEHPATYAYLDVMDDYLVRHGFPRITRVKYQGKKTSYATLGENCLTKGMLPSLAYGSHKHSCSLKFKVAPMDAWLNRHFAPIVEARRARRPVTIVRVIGYDAGVNDRARSDRFTAKESPKRGPVRWHYWYPLQAWGWDRERIVREIIAAGLPVPRKSSCVFCPSTRPHELIELAIDQPDLAWRIIEIERRAGPNLDTLDGLWRAGVKGTRGGVAKPGSMTEFLIEWMADGRAYRALPSLSDPRIAPSELLASRHVGPAYRRALPVVGQDPGYDAQALARLAALGHARAVELRARYERTFGPYLPGASIAAAAERAARAAKALARARRSQSGVDAARRAYDAALAAYAAARTQRGASEGGIAKALARFARKIHPGTVA